MTPMRLEPAALRSRVKHSTSEPLRSQKVLQVGVHFDNFFLVDDEREDPSTTISGPYSARQRNAIKWRFTGVPVTMMAQH